MISLKSKFCRPIVASVLSGIILALSPGIPCYQVLAAVVDAAPESTGAGLAVNPLPLSLGENSLPISRLELPLNAEQAGSLNETAPLPSPSLLQKGKEAVQAIITPSNTLSRSKETPSHDLVPKVSFKNPEARKKSSRLWGATGIGKKISGFRKSLLSKMARLKNATSSSSEVASLGLKISNVFDGVRSNDGKGRIAPDLVADLHPRSLKQYLKLATYLKKRSAVDTNDIVKTHAPQNPPASGSSGTPSKARVGILRRALTIVGGTFLATAIWNILQARSVFPPSFSIIHNPFDFMGLMGAFLLKFASVPQTVKNFRIGKLATKDISLKGTLIWFAASALLFVVSLLKHSSPIWIFSNIIGVAQGALMGAQIVFYNHNGFLPLLGSVGVAGLMIFLITSGMWTPMAMLIPVLFWIAMSLVLSINIPQIIKNYKLYSLEHRAPVGIDPLYPGVVAMGSFLSLLIALHRLDVYWTLINITAIVMPLIAMAQILKPKIANEILSKIPIPKKWKMTFVDQESSNLNIARGASKEEKVQNNTSLDTVNPLTQNLIDYLSIYHRLDGRKDKSKLDGIQYPAVPQVKNGDEMGLKSFIRDLSVFLANQPGINYLPAPTGPGERQQFRKALAEKSAKEIEEYATQEFNAIVESLRDENIKTFVKKALAKAQPEFWRAPSSASGRYHPADEITAKGLIVHSIRDAIVGRALANYFGLSGTEKDIIVAALLIHDIEKGGIPWKHDLHSGSAPDSGYVPNHGPIAGDWLKQFKSDSCGPKCDEIIQDISAHMAQWNKPPTPPKTLGEQIVSYSDYLASHDSLYVSWRSSKGVSNSSAK
jgi:uncharacterized protein with PQ loop repeat